MLASFFNIVKLDELSSLQTLSRGLEILNKKITQKDKDELTFKLNNIKNLEDDQIVILPEQAAKDMVKAKDIFFKMVPFFGYVKI